REKDSAGDDDQGPAPLLGARALRVLERVLACRRQALQTAARAVPRAPEAHPGCRVEARRRAPTGARNSRGRGRHLPRNRPRLSRVARARARRETLDPPRPPLPARRAGHAREAWGTAARSEEHTSELQSRG